MVRAGVTTLDEVLGATNEDDEKMDTVATVTSELATSQTEIITLPESIESVTKALDVIAPTLNNTSIVTPIQSNPEAKTEEDKAREAAEKWRMLKSTRQGTQSPT